MARVEAAEIIVVPVVAIVVAPVPVARRSHPMDQAAMMQHRQIEAAAVPRYELRRVAVDAVEEPANQLRLRIGALSQRPDAKILPFAQRAGDGDNAMQVQRQKVVAGCGTPLLERPVEHVGVAKRDGQGVDAADSRKVGNRLDVANERWSHRTSRSCFDEPVLSNVEGLSTNGNMEFRRPSRRASTR